MSVNWKLRFRNKSWWMSIIPAIALCAQALARLFGLELNLGEQTDKLMVAIDTIFVVLTLAGVSVDPTTHGWADSDRAMGYSEPVKREIPDE